MLTSFFFLMTAIDHLQGFQIIKHSFRWAVECQAIRFWVGKARTFWRIDSRFNCGMPMQCDLINTWYLSFQLVLTFSLLEMNLCSISGWDLLFKISWNFISTELITGIEFWIMLLIYSAYLSNYPFESCINKTVENHTGFLISYLRDFVII